VSELLSARRCRAGDRQIRRPLQSSPLDESLSAELRSVRVPAARGLQRNFQTGPSQVCLAVNQQARETKALAASLIPPERRL
jgi:hypothetical protein